MANSVNISIEAPIENQIQEITYDGQEIYQAPLSMSENLARLAQKIDFSKTEDEYCSIKKEGESSSESKSDDDKDLGYQSSLWPWDSIRNKLRNALTEVCVLADVLSIAKEKRYMVLDPVQPEQVESRPMVQVYGRKKALGAAAAVLLAGTLPGDGAEQHWQQKLEAAQNVLFCKELFARLAAEAVQLDASIPHMVVGNHIMATVLPGIQLLIGLRHNNGQNNINNNPEGIKPEGAAGKADHDHVLEHSLHQLLRAVHHASTHHPFPHPATGPLGPSKRRCLAGPMAADRYELLDMSKEQSLLEQIIQQAQHFFMRRRSEYVLDTIAKEVKDPLIVSHWNALNSPTQSCVKINIMAYGYDAVCRTSLVVHVGEKTLKCICRDGKVRHLSYELQELRDLIFCQIYQHQMTAVQAVGRCMGWQLLASSSHLGSGPVELLGNASSCLLASPNGDRMIAIRCEPLVGIQVFIAQSPRKDFFASELVQDKKWENLGGAFKEIKLDKMEGKNFLNKMELLMACLSSPS